MEFDDNNADVSRLSLEVTSAVVNHVVTKSLVRNYLDLIICARWCCERQKS